MASSVLTNDQLLESQDIVARLREFSVRNGSLHGGDANATTSCMVRAVLDDEPGQLTDLEAGAAL